MKKKKRRGLFITLDGCEGAGKSTMLEVVDGWLRHNSTEPVEVVRVREPGGTPLGEKIRKCIMDSKADSSDNVMSDILLFIAAKYALYHEVIKPALARGAMVISDRWTDSLFAYQGGGYGAKKEVIDNLLVATGMDINPDLTFYLDVPYHVSHQRVRQRGITNAMDVQTKVFFDSVRRVYRRRVKEEGHILQIDATKPEEIVEGAIKNALSQRVRQYI